MSIGYIFLDLKKVVSHVQRAIIDILIPQFNSVSSVKKTSDATITTTDCLLSAFAMFNLKLPSLLKFDEKFRDKENTTEAENLKNLFKIKNVPSDTYMSNCFI